MSRIGVLWRELRPDRNPLRRACDRAEAGVLAVVIAVFLVAVPLAAVISGGRTYAAGLRAERAEQAAWREVPAVLLAAAPASGPDGYQATTRAAWTAPDGARRAGPVTAPAGTPAGHTVRLWVDASGQPTGQPLQPDDVTSRAATIAVATASGAAAVLLGAAAAARWALFRRRLAAWDSEWRITGPRWTSLR